MSGIDFTQKNEKVRICGYCGKSFTAKTSKAKFCSTSCALYNRYKDPNSRLQISLSHSSEKHKLGYKKQAETLRQKFANGEIHAWNKGLRAKTDERVRIGTKKQAAVLRKRATTDEEYYSFLKENAIKGGRQAAIVNAKRLKGKSWSTLYGEEKTRIMKDTHPTYIHLGITKCSKCGIMLTLDNILLLGRSQKKRRLCKNCFRLQSREHNKKEQIKLYLKLFEAVGTKCSRCGFSDLRALQIDHINGKTIDEKDRRLNPLFDLRKLSLDEIREKYQLLCANCNWIKRYENNENVADHSHSAKFEASQEINQRSQQ